MKHFTTHQYSICLCQLGLKRWYYEFNGQVCDVILLQIVKVFSNVQESWLREATSLIHSTNILILLPLGSLVIILKLMIKNDNNLLSLGSITMPSNTPFDARPSFRGLCPLFPFLLL